MLRHRYLILAAVLLLSGCPKNGKEITVLAFNDLGMHCMNEDFSELMILPPYNVLHAQVIARGFAPKILDEGVTVEYSVPGNTTSADKTNFWDYVDDLMGVDLEPNVGLTGNGLAGTMVATGDNDWFATGIPITPIMDDETENAYPLARVVATRDSGDTASTQAVVPVSWEIRCDLCHDEDGVSTETDILREHDEEHDTNLEASKPVMCGQCHAQLPLGTAGQQNIPSLSRAMHGAHANRMGEANLDVSCYACHPGQQTQCLRGVHFSKGLTCVSCHGDMTSVANENREPWKDEPKCGSCHTRAGFQFEQDGKLFRESKGHHGVHCAACHGSPHAITPTVVDEDNVQAVEHQGHAGVIDTCTVCHISPMMGFDHKFDG